MGHLGLVAGEYPGAVADHAGDARAVAIVGFISKAPLWMWAGGAFGVCFMALALMLLPKLGASGFMALALAGQVVASWCWITSGGLGWCSGGELAAGIGRLAIDWRCGVDSVWWGFDKELAAVG
jgi:hypothetical protein